MLGNITGLDNTKMVLIKKITRQNWEHQEMAD
jgi:hypothetical protein